MQTFRFFLDNYFERIRRWHAIFYFTLLSACAPNWSYVDIETLYSANDVTADSLVTDPDNVEISVGDYPGEVYQKLGDIRVRAYGFASLEGTKSDLNWALRKEASRLGADAVIYTKYGNRTVKEVGFFTYDATGTAIKFWRAQ